MPPEIEAIILQALERDRTKRFDSAESFLAALEAARNTAPTGVVLGDVTTVKLPSRPSSDPPPATPVLLTSRGPTAVQLAAPRSSTPALRVLVAGFGVAVLVLGVAVLVGGRGKNPGEARREALAAAPPVDAARPGEPPAGPADHGTGHGDQPPARDGRRLASPPEPLPSIPNSGEPHAVPPAGGAPPDPGRGGPDRASPPAGADASRGLPASPSRRGVRAAFERARTRVRSCVGGTIRQAVTVRAVARGSDGRIRQVRIDGVSGRDATDCVARAVSDVRVPRFAGSDTLVPHTYGPDSRGDGNGLGARDGPPMLTGRSGTRILTQYEANP
jgi:hypothetical protein